MWAKEAQDTDLNRRYVHSEVCLVFFVLPLQIVHYNGGRRGIKSSLEEEQMWMSESTTGSFHITTPVMMIIVKMKHSVVVVVVMLIV